MKEIGGDDGRGGQRAGPPILLLLHGRRCESPPARGQRLAISLWSARASVVPRKGTFPPDVEVEVPSQVSVVVDPFEERSGSEPFPAPACVPYCSSSSSQPFSWIVPSAKSCPRDSQPLPVAVRYPALSPRRRAVSSRGTGRGGVSGSQLRPTSQPTGGFEPPVTQHDEPPGGLGKRRSLAGRPRSWRPARSASGRPGTETSGTSCSACSAVGPPEGDAPNQEPNRASRPVALVSTAHGPPARCPQRLRDGAHIVTSSICSKRRSTPA